MAVIGQEQRIAWSGGAVDRTARRVKNLARSGAALFKSGDQPPSASSKWIVAPVEIVLVIAIGAIFGRIVWSAFGPLPNAEAPPAPQARSAPAAIAAANPFRPLAAPAATTAPEFAAAVETALDLKLHGTWFEHGQVGSAIIQESSKPQKVFRVGEEIISGATLDAVYADHVIILRGGAREALRLPRLSNAAAVPFSAPSPVIGAAPSPTAPPSSASVPFEQVVMIQPRTGPGGAYIIELYPADATRFEALGLKAGDMLVSVNNAPAPKDLPALSALVDQLRGAGDVSVVISRGGVETPLRLSLREPEL